MHDLIKSSLAEIPRYFMDMVEVTVQPKAFLHALDASTEDRVNRSFVFMGITILVTELMQIPMLPSPQRVAEHLSTKFLASTAIFAMLSILSLLATRAAWFAVGGKATIKQLFVYIAYLSGPISYIFLVFLITGDVLFKLLDPVTAELLRKNPVAERAEPTLLINEIFLLCGIVAIFAWTVYTWGAFRALNQVSRVRSAIAFVLSMAFSAPLMVLMLIMGMYVYPELLLPPSP